MMKKLLTILVLPLFFIGLSASAQVRDSDINLSFSPAYPAPNENVRAVLNSQVVDVNKALISWSINGEAKLQGIGKTDFQFNAGGMGTITNVSVSIDTVNGTSIKKNISIRPAEIDMLWEAPNSYVPPFYKGKALPVSQGKIKVVAMPSFGFQGGKINSKNLSYVWSKDGKGQPQFSGWGKNYIIFQNSYLDRENEVIVQASDIVGGVTAAGRAILTTGNPKILFYRKDPVFGTNWGQALSNGFFMNPGGETIVLEPYFFSENQISSTDLKINWFLNGQSISSPDPRNELSLRLESGQSGSAVIKTTVENVKALFQEASKGLRVEF